MGAVLHDPQDFRRHARHVSARRQQAGVEGGRRDRRVGRRLEQIENRRTHAADSARGIRRHGGIALQFVGAFHRRSLGAGRRSLHEEGIHESAGVAARRITRIARQHAYPAGDRRGAAVRNFRRHAIPRRGRLLLLRSHHRARLCHRRHSNGEGWQSPPRQLADELKRSVATAECCCAYNMMKLTRHLYSWTADPRFFDYYERVMFNHRIGTIQPQTGHTQYYLSLTPGAYKTFGTEDQSFWCCTGSGVEEYSKLNDSIYWKDDSGVYVNLFIPSELNWKEKGFSLKQETKFPQEAGTTLTVTAERPAQVALRLRIPEWVASAPVIKINGRALEATAAGGSYFSIARQWKTGDKIEMSLPMKLRVEAMPDDLTLQAFLYGPTVLAGDLGSEGLTDALITGPNAPRMHAMPQLTIPEFTQMGEDPAMWIKPADSPLGFRTKIG